MIILTSEQADAVRGETTPGHALEPVLLADGVTFVLPEGALTDPAHAAKWEDLRGLPTRAVAAEEYVNPGAEQLNP